MEVQDSSGAASTPLIRHSSLDDPTAPSASTSVISSSEQVITAAGRSSPSSSVDSSPVTRYFDFPPDAQAEGVSREVEGWSGFSFASGGSGESSGRTPPSSYTPSLSLALSRSLDKGKGRERSTEVEASPVKSPAAEAASAEELHGISEINGKPSRWEGEEAVRAGAAPEADSAIRFDAVEEPSGSPRPPESTLCAALPVSTTSSPAAAAPASPQRSRAFSFSRRLSFTSRINSQPTDVSTAPPTPHRHFSRSQTSMSSSRPSSFLSLTRSRSKTSSNESGSSSPVAGPRSRSSAKMLKALSFIRPGSSKGSAPINAEEAAAPSVDRPPRPRSHSAPLLHTIDVSPRLSDASPFVTAVSTPVTETPPQLLPPVELRLNLFDFLLPREVRLKILGMLVEICVEEHEREVAEGKWKGARAREKWVGEAKGRRELVRVSRVSHTWHALAFDGQHWKRLPTALLGAELLQTPFLRRLVGSAGTFLHILDLRGMTRLRDDTLVELTNLSLKDEGTTNFTSLNMTGCLSLTSTSLNYLLERSPRLSEIDLHGLEYVDSSTVVIIQRTARNLQKINLSGCRKTNAALLWGLSLSIRLELERRRAYSHLRELRASGLSGFNDQVLYGIMKLSPHLEVLDISRNPLLTDGAFELLVRGDGLSSTCPTRDLKPYQKRQFPLKHLNLSSLPNITDLTFRYLAHSLPSLTHLELSEPSRLFHGPGLIRLLGTTPHITHLDLENCQNLSDDTALHLPPSLIHLNLSSCRSLTEGVWDPLLARLINLEHLEADGTSISATSAYAFVASRRGRAGGAEGALISVLDNRAITRQVHKQGAAMTRPRLGQRGYWTTPLGYHDGPSEGEGLQLRGVGGGRKARGGLEECDETRVVVRSFYGHQAVDTADARRRTSEKVARATKVVRRRSEGERGMSCIVS